MSTEGAANNTRAQRGKLTLEAIASKYHERLRTPAAFSDSLSEALVVPALREAIVEGVLPPGSQLSEVQIQCGQRWSASRCRKPRRESRLCERLSSMSS